MYKSLYHNNRFHCISSIPEKANTQKQKGEWERLLCGGCEQHISKYERYASLLLMGGAEISVKSGDKVIEVSGIDYRLFKLFQLSILWRASISSRSIFRDVSLGKHEDIIRIMLLNNEPGESYQYGCIMFATMHKGKHIDSLIIQPELKRIDGQVGYRFVFGGFWWLYFCSSHKPNKKILDVFLQKHGIGFIFLKELGSADHIVQFAVEANI
ncbi:MAG: hypothetical protein RPU51_01515 [Candidatus Sedimenticola sp. (ex Thyasira tokunagai)]